jgi:NADPH-dependent glutamate synthase beta subunit-like oxidoreductase/NAD(P)H-flavin reductase
VEKAPPEAGPDAPPRYKLNPLAVPLHGCPLDERIGEMNFLRAEGDSVGALCLVVIDNPMCPGTGHRICNDCMRSCIFQKQEPVNIPQAETGVLTDVLFLPWGFEIYSLLTRWNPLNISRPVMRPYNGRNVLVVGLGPAGYTLAHYLANEGFGVIGIDGLKIEPLPVDLIGDEHSVPQPIKDMKAMWERLDERLLAGFGGVSEYGITVRWDKNFLQCVRIALERRRNVRFYGGVRFGGTITIEDAFDLLGFDHIAIAAGAGTPTLVRMKNNLIRGIRKASDFLMALQLTGAFKKNSLANLQVRLPALVVGGGLTAIDTATELFAYYPVHVEKLAERYEILSAEFGTDKVRAAYDAEELGILDEFLSHAAAVRAERARAATAGEPPNFIPLVRSWGGVTIAYRKSLVDSPAYRLNYEEVAKAMEEGIGYLQSLSPVEAVADEFGHVKSVLFEQLVLDQGKWMESGKILELPARSVMVAAGTSPNVIYEKEHSDTFRLDSRRDFFQSHRVEKNGSIRLIPVESLDEPPGFFTSYQHPRDERKLISFYGDNHPRYAGNVVKAMASARDGYKHVADLFPDPASGAQNMELWDQLIRKLDDGLIPRVHQINRLTPTIVEVVVRAPFAAERFKPGQFYRLQNYESLAPEIHGTRLTMEGIALTGAWTDPNAGLLSLIILEMGGSSRLCATLRIGEPVVVMGPTGTPTEIPKNEPVLLAGGGLGNAVLFSIAKALRDNGCRVVYFAGYKKAEDVFKQDDIEAGTDQVVWSVDAGVPIPARRPQDLSFVGNIVQSILAYAGGAIGPSLVSLKEVTRVIAIGSDGMMRAVKEARHGMLAPFLSPDHIGIASINSPMQCMMKQVCAQCLQRHVDPVTGRESFVFSCFNQDQPMDQVDFINLRARLRQNTVEEKLTNLWLTRLLAADRSASRD